MNTYVEPVCLDGMYNNGGGGGNSTLAAAGRVRVS